MLLFWLSPRMSTSHLMLQVPLSLLCFFILHRTLCLYSTRSVWFVSSGQLRCTATSVSRAVCTHARRCPAYSGAEQLGTLLFCLCSNTKHNFEPAACELPITSVTGPRSRAVALDISACHPHPTACACLKQISACADTTFHQLSQQSFVP